VVVPITLRSEADEDAIEVGVAEETPNLLLRQEAVGELAVDPEANDRPSSHSWSVLRSSHAEAP